jgi:hypothetical protein
MLDPNLKFDYNPFEIVEYRPRLYPKPEKTTNWFSIIFWSAAAIGILILTFVFGESIKKFFKKQLEAIEKMKEDKILEESIDNQESKSIEQ